MNKSYWGLWALLLAALVLFAALSVKSDGLRLGNVQLKTATFARDVAGLFSGADAAADSLDADGRLPNGRHPKGWRAPMDTTAKTILFIGDSMLEGLGPRLAAYCDVSGHTLIEVIWYSSSTLCWGETARLSELIGKYHPNYIMVCLGAKPNQAHIALAKLEQQGKLKAVVTQNIDGLHQAAGSKRVYELHGSVLRNYCMKCHKFYDISAITDSTGIPKCTCGGIIKPDVVLYEEGLDDKTVQGAVRAIAKADVLIIGGTSLAVYPAAGFLNYFSGRKIVLLNKSATAYDAKADIVIRDPIGQVLGSVV